MTMQLVLGTHSFSGQCVWLSNASQRDAHSESMLVGQVMATVRNELGVNGLEVVSAE